MSPSQTIETTRPAMSRFTDLASGLRGWVRDSPLHVRAAVDLLIWDQTWLQRPDFTGACVTQLAPGLVARIDWGEARRFVDRGFAQLGRPAVPARTVDRRVLAAAVAIGQGLFVFPGMAQDCRNAITQAFAASMGVQVPEMVRGGTRLPAFDVANAERSAMAAARDAELGRRALEVLGPACLSTHRVIALARIARPEASWAEVAEEVGLTKDQATSRFRRMIDAARKKGL